MTIETIKPSRAEYQRNWRAANREHCNQWNREYMKLRRSGLRRGSKKIPVSQRFDSKWTPEPFSGCWIWIASVDPLWKYGCIFVDGRPQRAHRVSWTIYRGEIPKGLRVLHRCDTPECVNPDHLFLGTDKDNVLDMLKKGRAGKKLTVDQVLKIRQDNRPTKVIADDFGIHPVNVRAIQTRKQWRYV